MISISNLAKSYGDRTLFSGASFQLNAGERYGLVGANGSGKTTFLEIVSGELEASEGTVTIPKRLRLGVLRQDLFLYEDEEILAVAMMGNAELWEAMVEKEDLLAKAEEYFDADRFSALEETVQRYDGYTAEARATKILEGLGLPGHIHRDPLSTLSGGFKLRMLLAQVLAGAPDVLLLDEPTNHLDILSIRWLEVFLRDFAGPRRRDLPRSPFSRQRLDVHPRRRLRVRAPLSRGLHDVSPIKAGRAGAPGEGDRREGTRDRASPEVRGSLPRQGEQGAPGAEQGAHDREESGGVE